MSEAVLVRGEEAAGSRPGGKTLAEPSKLVAIVVPLSKPLDRRPEVAVSLRHLEHYLGHYDRYVIAAESVEVDMPGYGIERFDDRYFGSLRAHDRLMLSAEFYERFRDYKYILIHHTDALVLSDRLLEWCAMDYDWVPSPSWHAHIPEPKFVVGNGGFSLRKVEAFLRIFRSTRPAMDPDEYWRQFRAKNPGPLGWLHYPKKWLKHLHRFNSVQFEIARGMRERIPEDGFVIERGPWYAPGFRIAPLDVALRFGFDDAPRRSFELTKGALPFGCHGWFRADREFWEPYLLK